MDDFIKKFQQRRIDGKYSLTSKIGEGGHGAVYRGQNVRTGEDVALKLVHWRDDISSLEDEVAICRSFDGLLGFPKLYSYSEKDDYKVIVLELLGPSLEDMFVFCDRKFSLKTTLMLFDQLLVRFQALHSKKYIHRDVKPQNCLMGSGSNGNIVYLTDFGLAREAVEESKEVVSNRPRLIGTTRYASIRGHMGQVQTRSDDLESLGYMIIYFCRGSLPWQGIKARGDKEKDQLVMEMKQTLDEATLCSTLPQEFEEYMRYTKSLLPGRKPNYNKLRKLFHDLAAREDIQYDNVFDWTELLFSFAYGSVGE